MTPRKFAQNITQLCYILLKAVPYLLKKVKSFLTKTKPFIKLAVLRQSV